AKKSLGQNFLKSGSALRAIIVAGDIKPGDTILEIGPGKGALTSKILETGAKVIAVEKDRELIPYLEVKFAKEIESKQLTLIEEDILELSAKQILGNITSYKLIANIPYYITGEIIRKYFEENIQPEKMVLLVQKEVAVRIVARDNKASILSIACKAYSTPQYVQTVKREAFNPAPNVDSAIIAFENINKDLFKKGSSDEASFFEVMKLGFAHKRKKLGGNLKEIANTLNQIKLEEIKDKRPENLIVRDWIDLIQK
ncbi:MAG: 16S rRNA (adenine(1518)-N(6)/adenine(1519)-N(6))-dimethyltransferase RsmA, partial [Patescibacteria group bacterium]